jgi:hypothetical protein
LNLQTDQLVFGGFPLGSDIEVIAALRHFLRESGRRPEQLDEVLGLHPGTVAAVAAGWLEPPGPLLRGLCVRLGIARWAFHLTGAIVVGADLGIAELAELLERRRRQRAGNPDQITDADLAVEAVEILLAIGEDASPERGSRRGLVDGVKRLARRAEQRLGEPGAACLLEAVAVIVLKGVESLSGADLERVVALTDLARSLEDGTEA